MSFANKKNKIVRGWLTYRQNLIVLYEEMGISDSKIDDLINKTEYCGPDGRPDAAQQWVDLNEIELRLFRLLDEERLVAETKRKFLQAKQSGLSAHLAPLQERFLAVEGGGAQAEAERRALAIAYLEEMFIKYSYQFYENEKRAEVSRRLMWFGLTIIGIPTALVFLGPILEAVLQTMGWSAQEAAEDVAHQVAQTLAEQLAESAAEQPADTVTQAAAKLAAEEAAKLAEQGVGSDDIDRGFLPADYAREVFRSMTWSSSRFSVFFVVLYFGIVGAYFSRLFGYVKKLESLGWREMDLVYSLGALSVRLLVGAIGAVILFFLMTGEILSGPLFLETGGAFTPWQMVDPNSAYPEPMSPLRPTADFARLIVWCTLAGFFERFVPDRFGELDESAKASSANSPK